MGLTFKQILTRNLINIPGVRSKRKIVVLESDDWGTIRIPSAEISKKLVDHHLVSKNDPYAKFDCLESNEDMSQLFEILTSIRDCVGNHPIITANTVLANPDFKKILEADFTEYHFESFQRTHQRYLNHDKVFDLYQLGIEQKIFIPQLHGREHLNVASWMRLLKERDPRFKLAFDFETFAIETSSTFSKRNNLMAALEYTNEEEKNNRKQMLSDAYQLFYQLFGYYSTSFIAPCYIWDDAVESELSKLGVSIIQTTAIQGIPEPRKGHNKKRFHYTGQQNKFGQKYFIRNCFFEPSIYQNTDCVDSTLKSIQIAFQWGKPAIISSHRLNYMGSLDEQNRTKNLQSLKCLLNNIITKWPDVEFCSTNQLANIFSQV
jgi:hypothetical protein